MTLTQEDIKIIKDIVGDYRGPKIQWSKFSPDRSEQYVIRVDTYEELEDLRRFVLQDIPKAGKAFPDDTGPVATATAQPKTDVCPIHLKPYRDGKYGKFCATKLQDGTWCKEKPKG